jgi:cobalt/nickel transport protein
MTGPRTAGSRTPSRRISTRTFTIVALAVALLIACFLSIWASSQPDGLEFVAESTGFLGSAEQSAVAGGPFADYRLLGIDDPALSLAVAGAIGCGATFGLAWLVSRVARRRGADDD